MTEPSIEDAAAIIRGIKGYYEKYHNVRVSDATAKRIVVLSGATSATATCRTRRLTCSTRPAPAPRCATKSSPNSRRRRSTSRRSSRSSRRSSAQSVDYEALAEAKYKVASLTEKLDAFEPEEVTAAVGEADLAYVIELWTGIPAAKIEQSELGKLAHIEEKLREKIIGQDEAVQAVSAAIRRSRVQINPRRRPASFIFVGPTGTGKTELVRVLSKELFDSPETLIRLDMSEFMEKHSVSKIIGSPRAMSATTRPASSPRRCAAARTPFCCSTKSRRRIRM